MPPNKHKMITVGQMEEKAQQYNQDHDDEAQSECPCTNCKHERKEYKCENPNGCLQTAKKIMQCLLSKWNPGKTIQTYASGLTIEEQNRNEQAAKKDQKIIFNPTVTKTCLNNGFHIFTGKTEKSKDPAEQTTPPISNNGDQSIITLITSGRVHTEQNTDRIASGAAFFKESDPRNLILKMEAQTNTTDEGELKALYQAIRHIPKHQTLHIEIEFKTIIQNLTTNLARNEKQDWLGNKNKKTYKATIAELRQRSKETTIIRSTKTNNSATHRTTNKLAEEAIKKPTLDIVNTELKENFDLKGIELTSGTQALFYKCLREQKQSKDIRRCTLVKLDITRHAVQEWTGTFPTNKYSNP